MLGGRNSSRDMLLASCAYSALLRVRPRTKVASSPRKEKRTMDHGYMVSVM